jgi:hypothetical protein
MFIGSTARDFFHNILQALELTVTVTITVQQGYSHIGNELEVEELLRSLHPGSVCLDANSTSLQTDEWRR